MTTFEDKLHASAQRMMTQDNKRIHVPQNPLKQKKAYWGWVATPAAAVIGIIFGMSMNMFLNNEPSAQYAQATDTIRIDRPVHDTLYLTQIIEKEKVIIKQAAEPRQAAPTPVQEETETPTCSSIQCDGISYSILASN